MRILSITIVVSLLTLATVAQERVGMLSAKEFCSYYGEKLDDTVYTFTSDQEALAAIDRVLRPTGLNRNFVIRAASVQNAAAVIEGGQRYILYSQAFMRRVKETTNTDWAALSILAHELGHHLQGHTLLGGGSRPPLELEADEFSGFALANMGATLQQTQLAMSTFGSSTGSPTHPPKAARLAAIEAGYTRATDVAREVWKGKTNGAADPARPRSNTGTNTGSSPQKPSENVEPQPLQPRFALQCAFPGDPAAYYVTVDNQIVGVAPTGHSLIVGTKIPPTVAGFDWMYSTRSITYGVDSYGRVWNRTPTGIPFQVGQCARTM